jgi:PIN domain nuclease of toxin-antitoxin system
VTAYLLDTSALLLASLDDSRFNAGVREKISTEDVVVSQVCAIEIAIKQSIGRLDLPNPFGGDFSEVFHAMIDAMAATVLDIDMDDIDRLSRLPLHHRDPFDRLIIAQGLRTGMTVITSDRAFSAYSGLSVLEI